MATRGGNESTSTNLLSVDGGSRKSIFLSRFLGSAGAVTFRAITSSSNFAPLTDWPSIVARLIRSQAMVRRMVMPLPSLRRTSCSGFDAASITPLKSRPLTKVKATCGSAPQAASPIGPTGQTNNKAQKNCAARIIAPDSPEKCEFQGNKAGSGPRRKTARGPVCENADRRTGYTNVTPVADQHQAMLVPLRFVNVWRECDTFRWA